MGRSPRADRRLRSFIVAERSLRARAKSMDRISKKPSVFKFGAETSMAELKGNCAPRGLSAVTVGLTGKSM
jgi:hypothetical protein